MREKIEELREQSKAEGVDLPEINKMIKSIEKQIEGVKAKESVFTNDKSAHQEELDRINSQKKYLINKIKEIRAAKSEAKEVFYGRLVDYEIQ